MSATDCIAAWFAERWGWSHAVQLTDADELLRVLSDAGYHLVQEGQAVVDGQVCEVFARMTITDGLIDTPSSAGSAYWLRPLPEPPPVVPDETTTTTTAKEAPRAE